MCHRHRVHQQKKEKGLHQGLTKAGFNWLLNFSVRTNYLEACGKHRFPGSMPK